MVVIISQAMMDILSDRRDKVQTQLIKAQNDLAAVTALKNNTQRLLDDLNALIADSQVG